MIKIPIALRCLALPNFALVAALAFCGCKSIGPGTVARDRYDYSSSISESWKRQTLLNIVKLRYLDPPIFVDVGQIVAGYTLETGASLGGQLALPQDNSLSLGVSGKYTDRPTVTYVPLTGNEFVRALMTPLPPESVFFMIQSGWPADGVLYAACASLNGLKNQETSYSSVIPPEPAFMRVLELLRNIQRSGAVSFRVKQDSTAKHTSSLLVFRAKDVPPQTAAEIRELRELLHLDQEADEFSLVFGSNPSNSREVAVVTRSILHIMSTMAAQVSVPLSDVLEGRAGPGLETAGGGVNAVRLVKIHNSKEQPDDACVAVFYRKSWFWIDDRDLASKRALAFMMMLFTLADSGGKQNLPMITIPAQ
jgi:hypothetical protein